MTRRRLFLAGASVEILTALAHLAGHLTGPAEAASPTEAELMRLLTTHAMELPGASRRTMWDLMSGFSLFFSLHLATMGVSGIVLARGEQARSPLLGRLATIHLVATAAALAVSLAYFFAVPSACIAVAAALFLASVAVRR